MTIVTKKFVRKPLYVDAVMVTAENFEEVARWCQGEILNHNGTDVVEINPANQYIKVRVHNPVNPRQQKAVVGDWLLYTERGYKIYTTKAFKNAFEATDAEDEVLEPTEADEGETEVPAATDEAIAGTPEHTEEELAQIEAAHIQATTPPEEIAEGALVSPDPVDEVPPVTRQDDPNVVYPPSDAGES